MTHMLYSAEAMEGDELDGGEHAAEVAMRRAFTRADHELHADTWRMVSTNINRLRVYGGGWVYNAQIVVEVDA